MERGVYGQSSRCLERQGNRRVFFWHRAWFLLILKLGSFLWEVGDHLLLLWCCSPFFPLWCTCERKFGLNWELEFCQQRNLWLKLYISGQAFSWTEFADTIFVFLPLIGWPWIFSWFWLPLLKKFFYLCRCRLFQICRFLKGCWDRISIFLCWSIKAFSWLKPLAFLVEVLMGLQDRLQDRHISCQRWAFPLVQVCYQFGVTFLRYSLNSGFGFIFWKVIFDKIVYKVSFFQRYSFPW